MSNVFHEYDQQYSELSINLSKKCSLAFSLKGGEKKEKLSEITYDLENAEKLISKMDHAASNLPPNIKFILLEKLRESKSSLKRLRNEIKRNTSENLKVTTREEVLEAEKADFADQRSRLMKSTEGLVRTREMIKDSQRKLLETENIGISILENLQRQKESLQNSQAMLHEIDDTVKESRSIVRSIKIKEFFTVTAPIIIYFLFKLVK
ncbi:putative vesicle transport v-SNARE domain superfamily protein [Arabidopsis thaliana]|uniref:SNARE domain n=1 Tax=Arabidopsis thaliana x Arabidopsis arenosa TaxID=1240361 RepID=A0A8T2D183_9BRAS|nr:SNARE domain [Arabidopsis thaliana x Arabidopsis arenosa]